MNHKKGHQDSLAAFQLGNGCASTKEATMKMVLEAFFRLHPPEYLGKWKISLGYGVPGKREAPFHWSRR